ncbi:hypothetical protein [Ornithinibacillus bavariensis]|uniref:hypothetical protein n=1 Tax=Ornithinibacillus bavariensis TaxID=545502 RepID=UPI003D23A14D
MRKTREITFFIVGSIGVFILILTWFYPFSIFGINKTYKIKPDPIVVDQYAMDLQTLKEAIGNDVKEGLSTSINYTVERTQSILLLFEKEWLLSKDPIKLKKSDSREFIVCC